MSEVTDFSDHIIKSLRSIIDSDIDKKERLNNTLRLLSKWRSVLIQNTLIAQSGCTVINGPLKGLNFLEQSAEGCHVAKLLGCYEQPLHTHIEDAIKRGYKKVVNIGSAEGYYTVGIALRLPDAEIYAFDTDSNAQNSCIELARKNGVEERVHVSGLFSPEDFTDYAGGESLVLCDIEGGEVELLNPTLSPALGSIDLIVEAHECLRPGVTELLMNRFSDTHEIILVEDSGLRNLEIVPPWFNKLAHLDQILATWEWRSGPTPWLVMTSRKSIRSD
jgi:hypothetical protein